MSFHNDLVPPLTCPYTINWNKRKWDAAWAACAAAGGRLAHALDATQNAAIFAAVAVVVAEEEAAAPAVAAAGGGFLWRG